MKLERAAALGAGPYQRSDGRKGYANGFKPKTVQTRVGALTLAVPQARGVEFYPSALEKGLRSERALKLAVAEMYVQGVSTRKVAAITEKLCGLEVTSGQVSRAAGTLDAELEKWRGRPLGETPYLILGVSVSLSEAEAHWRDFLASLAGRGLHGVKLVVTDDHAGLKEALAARLT